MHVLAELLSLEDIRENSNGGLLRICYTAALCRQALQLKCRGGLPDMDSNHEYDV
jgi:hypothetical protein